ncbi:MAG: 5-bromo-4-chloroindolyl phosphate hydrolysis family protein [Christensenellales bacterium]|jgi:hypothetical protein
MARKKRKSQAASPAKGLVWGGIAGGALALGYGAVFSPSNIFSYVLMGVLALVVGRIAYIMGSGLDTSQTAPAMSDMPATGIDHVDQLIARGQGLLREIRAENSKIPDPVLSKQIDDIERVSDRIFRTVAERPNKAPQIRRFMDYYLPTTLKMLKSYRTMDEREVRGASADQVRRKIESAMDVVLGAFHKQLDMLQQDSMLDISTDIDVLETMLKQDSLIGSSFGAAQAQKEEKQ